jgi:Gpi18-like mannosyltransferase
MSRTLNVCIILFLFLFIIILLPALPGQSWDRFCWTNWVVYIYHNGLTNVYGSGTDYLPAYHYILWLYSKIQGNENDIRMNIAYLRAFTLVFDFVGLWYVYLWTDKKTPYITILLFSILNIAYSYNTVIWGQVDGIFSALMFISLYYAWCNKMLLSTLLLLLAINFKLQAIFILPIWGLLYISNLINTPDWKKIVYPLSAAFVLQVIIVIPFTMGHYGLSDIVSVVKGSVGKHPFITIGAANFWLYIIPDYLANTNDQQKWIAGLSYNSAGLIMFLFTSLLVLLPLITEVFKKANRAANRRVVLDRQIVLLSAALIYIIFFYFNTEMHERYSHPAFIFITAYAFFTKDFIAYILFSVTYFLNLERALGYLHINHNTLIFDFRFIAVMYAVTIIYLSFKLYKSWKRYWYHSSSNNPITKSL